MKVLLHPNDILGQRAEEVVFGTIDTYNEINLLSEEMRAVVQDNSLIGISGNQIGVKKRIFIVAFGVNEDGTKNMVTFINPVIKVKNPKDTALMFEGCASLPNMEYMVKRPKVITVTAKNVFGIEFGMVLGGIASRAVQHENSHLNGKLLIDMRNYGTRDV